MDKNSVESMKSAYFLHYLYFKAYNVFIYKFLYFLYWSKSNDSSLINFSSKLKIIAYTQANALNSAPLNGHIVTVSIKYKSTYIDNPTIDYMVVFDSDGKIRNSRIKSEYRKELGMQIYTISH